MPVSTLPQPSLSTGVAGTGPAFSAYASGSTTLSTGTWTKITLDAEEFDTNNNFASSRFTPTVAGYYQVSGCYQFNGTTAGYIGIYKNGSAIKYGVYTGAAGAAQIINMSALVYLNGSTDYIELYGYLNAGSTTVAGSAVTYFQGALVRAA